MSEDGPGWYFTRKEIEENSPSKRDGIDWKKECWLRRSYCTFLQSLGMRLKVPQKTIATAITFCHRFYLRQSFGRNDRRVIATVCMFLAGKVEDSPRHLKDVILVSYEIINQKDPLAARRIKQKDVYEQQKELILVGERLVLQTLSFDLELNHPYEPLRKAINKFEMAQNPLNQVAWNFVNDGLRTCLCLQFQPHHISAGAIFLAAKFLKVKLPSDGERVWWQEFGVTPRQLEEISNQTLELYEQYRVPPSKPGASKAGLESSANHVEQPASNHSRSSDCGGAEIKHRLEDESKDDKHLEGEVLPHKGNLQEAQEMLRSRSGYGEEQESNCGRNEMKEAAENDKHENRNPDHRDGTFGRPPQEVIKNIDRDKVKAALEKQRKASDHITTKQEVMDDDDLIERVLEDGIELAAQSEKNKQDGRLNYCKPSYRSDNGNVRQELSCL